MLIQILRNTVAKPTGDTPRAVDVGEVIDVDVMQANQLIGLRKATAVTGGASHMTGIEHAVDHNALTAERRTQEPGQPAPTDWGDMLLSGIDGIGPKTAAKLADGGIETLTDLLVADPDALALAAGVSPATVEKWRQRVQAVVDRIDGQPT